jgi:hypothetical protein
MRKSNSSEKDAKDAKDAMKDFRYGSQLDKAGFSMKANITDKGL